MSIPRSGLWLAAVALTAGMTACSDEIGLPRDPADGIRYPIAFAPLPSGQHVLVAGANFDRKYRAGLVRIIDTATDKLVAGPGQEVPAFAGTIALQLSGDPTSSAADAAKRVPVRAFVVAREDDSLTLLDIAQGPPPKLTCGELDAEGRCALDHRYGDSTIQSNETLGNDPVDVEILPGPGGLLRVHTAATSSGIVTLATLDPDKSVKSLQVLDTVSLGAGPSDLLTVPQTGRTYVADSRANQLHVLRAVAGETAAQPLQWDLESPIGMPGAGGRDYGRGLALSSDGGRLYVAWRSPAAIAVVDVAPDSAGVPRNRLLDVIGVGRLPAAVAVAPTGPAGGDLIYVTCYGEDTIWVVDPQLRTVVDVIPLPHAPYAMAVVNVPGLDAATGQPKGWQLYAGLFNVHQVAVVPLQPGAAKRHLVRGLVGEE